MKSTRSASKRSSSVRKSAIECSYGLPGASQFGREALQLRELIQPLLHRQP
jgi:hypothetical protein